MSILKQSSIFAKSVGLNHVYLPCLQKELYLTLSMTFYLHVIRKLLVL